MKIKSIFNKKAAAFITSAAIFSASTGAFAEFTDISSDSWYSDAVQFMVDSGYMNGISDTEFAPDAGMTRGMFVTVIGRMDGANTGEYTKAIFPDVPITQWYAPYVNWALEAGIVTGFSDLHFYPDEQITRSQLAVMIKRYLDYRNIVLPVNPNAYDSYTDEAYIAEWAKEGADLMRTTGIITGDDYGNFMPDSLATRAQIAVTIMKLRAVINGETLEIPQRKERSKAEILLEGMTLKDKVYQMFMVSPEQITGVQAATMAGVTTKDAVTKYPVGAILYDSKNILESEQITQMVTTTAGYMTTAPFTVISEEPGDNSPLFSKLGLTKYNNAYTYKNDGTEKITEIYSNISTELKNHGFNTNLAPVADIWSNTRNTYISTRAFANDYQTAGAMTAAAVKASKENGILTAVKYFPGYGDCAENPNDGACYSYKTLDELKNDDFNTYKNGIDAGADFVVCANVNMPEVDPYYPASLSTIFVNDLLKGYLGFDGIIISGAQKIKAITSEYSAADAAVMAVDAGCDMIMLPANIDQAVNAIIQAVNDKSISESRINESVLKILNKKIEAGLIQG